jgi:hypothetical protein
VISTDKAALLWMYCKEIAPFETPTFSKNVGELIARATRAPQKAAVRRPKAGYGLGPREMSDLSPQSGPKQTLITRCHQSRF